MEIRHLKLVKTVAEEGNLTSAGKKLFLSQSALSHQLKELESSFGTRLFRRINKKMVLTQAGTRVLETANTVLVELEKAERDVKRFVFGETGKLRLSTECYTCYHWLPALLKSYSKSFPGIDVQIVADATRQPIKHLARGNLDLAIVSCLTRKDGDSSMSYQKLFTDEMVVVVNANHRFASLKTVGPDDFKDEHLICYSAPIEVLDIFQRVLIPAGVAPKKLSRIDLTEAIIEMVKAEIGITAMARWAIKPYLKSKKLATVPVSGKSLKRTWYAVTAGDTMQPKYIGCFVQHLLKHPIS